VLAQSTVKNVGELRRIFEDGEEETFPDTTGKENSVLPDSSQLPRDLT
jgi:hypothetical protein